MIDSERKRAHMRELVGAYRLRMKNQGFARHSCHLSAELTQRLDLFMQTRNIRTRQQALQLVIARGLDGFDTSGEEQA